MEKCYLFKEKLENKYLKDKKYCKVRDNCHYAPKYKGDTYSICNWKYSVPKKISIVCHNGSTYDYYFITKELEQEFQNKFTCLGEK